MSSRFSLIAGILIAPLASLPLSAQQVSGSASRDTSAARPAVAHGAASDSALVELGRAISALALSVQAVVVETAKNPEVRRAAVQTAGKAVTLAQKTLEENRGEIERLLAEASRRLATAEAEQKARSTAPAKP
ncbi:MAG: hypothetical protein ABIP93_13210 [Gemmatimonadaceae bacterium]